MTLLHLGLDAYLLSSVPGCGCKCRSAHAVQSRVIERFPVVGSTISKIPGRAHWVARCARCVSSCSTQPARGRGSGDERNPAMLGFHRTRRRGVWGCDAGGSTALYFHFLHTLLGNKKIGRCQIVTGQPHKSVHTLSHCRSAHYKIAAAHMRPHCRLQTSEDAAPATPNP